MPLMTLSEFIAYHKAQGAAQSGQLCPLCKRRYQAHGERYRIGDQEVCESCYFDGLGELVEAHPIGGGRRRA